MNRRAWVGTVAAGATTAGWVGNAAGQNNNGNGARDKCADACGECILKCLRCHAYCVEMLEKESALHAHGGKPCLDCAEFCRMCLSVCVRGGPMVPAAAEACAKACEMCAAECAKHPEDKMISECAAECLKCAKACRAVLAK